VLSLASFCSLNLFLCVCLNGTYIVSDDATEGKEPVVNDRSAFSLQRSNKLPLSSVRSTIIGSTQQLHSSSNATSLNYVHDLYGTSTDGSAYGGTGVASERPRSRTSTMSYPAADDADNRSGGGFSRTNTTTSNGGGGGGASATPPPPGRMKSPPTVGGGGDSTSPGFGGEGYSTHGGDPHQHTHLSPSAQFYKSRSMNELILAESQSVAVLREVLNNPARVATLDSASLNLLVRTYFCKVGEIEQFCNRSVLLLLL
jgi:hypothetical protein